MTYLSRCLLGGLAVALIGACPGKEPRRPADPAAPGLGPERGGRAYDEWLQDPAAAGFTPDDRATPEPDGAGGPFGNGTLRRAGAPLLNDGHDYRLKNFTGWDLRGADGIYGPAYMNRRNVASRNWLAGAETVDEIVQLLRDGDDELPAFGDVLPVELLREIATFIVDVREGRLPRPEQIYDLVPDSPGFYALRPGADPARGKALYQERCADCHGDDGTEIYVDEGAYSVGSHARQKGYEDWLKLLNGHPGSSMTRQVTGATGAEMAREILDVLAALCDRGAFPRGIAVEPDVADGDPRCGDYLR